MRLEIVHTGGRYFERLHAHLAAMERGPVVVYPVPRGLPPVLDDAAEFLPPELGAGDVIIAINIHPELLLEIPHQVGGGSVRALIAPVEDPSWVKPGLQRQVTQACAREGIECAFPKPFCSLEPGTPAMREFCETYRVGPPRLEFTVAGGRVAQVRVARGSPCGLTQFVAENLVGQPADESLVERATQLHHACPCLASMSLDPETGDTVLHASLDLLRRGVAQALRAAAP